MRRVIPQLDLRISLLYAAFGGVWIVLSDRLLAAVVKDSSAITAIQTYKGWFFVAASSTLIFALLRREFKLRRITEDKFDESEARYRQLFQSSQDAILLTAPNGSIYDANLAACHMFRKSEAEIKAGGRNGLVDLADPRLPLALAERAQTGKFSGELTFVRGDGTKFIGEISTSVYKSADGMESASMIIRDVTERKHAENEIRDLNAGLERRVLERTDKLRAAQSQLIQNEKLAVLGQVAGSIGHELLNPLGVISNAVYFLKHFQANSENKVLEYLDLIERHVHITEVIAANLVGFVRAVPAERIPISAQELISDALKHCHVPESIQCVQNLPADLPLAHVDPRLVKQALSNLALNAYQAMEPEGGTLTISANSEGQWLCLSLQDTGAGVSPEDMQRLFEPLFSTKLKGIGLGLAVSKKLVEAVEGKIEFHSEVGRGSVARVYLPVFS
jgi:PAS domain S-box-containing protein